ncbi:hypothetical protein BS50DRAFT_659883 [Corynespora cassiicola Philippines]|uniref:Uncharacterized protein n=1 Tax=Corynespora cassiicola Philippines TaxID=1448308 RepID=A0A2T2NZW9_CORCC|nr:hypothetical protein BS50DRAFT_659883 [Corynespora cassiicola Philippines]
MKPQKPVIYASSSASKSPPPPPTPPRLDLGALLTEAKQGDPTTPTPDTPTAPHNPAPIPIPIPAPNCRIDAYDPTAPLLSSRPTLHQKIQQKNAVRAIRDATQVYEHNPHLLSHLISNAPYVESYCVRCTRFRKCPLHRVPVRHKTDVSLCPHVRMNLTWEARDPANTHSTYRLEVRDYTHRDARFAEEHRGCDVLRPSERVGVLAERVVQDYWGIKWGKERGGWRRVKRVRDEGLERRIALELGALVGGIEFARAEGRRVREEEAETKKRKEHMQIEAQQKLAEALRMVQAMKEEETRGGRKLEQERVPEIHQAEQTAENTGLVGGSESEEGEITQGIGDNESIPEPMKPTSESPESASTPQRIPERSLESSPGPTPEPVPEPMYESSSPFPPSSLPVDPPPFWAREPTPGPTPESSQTSITTLFSSPNKRKRSPSTSSPAKISKNVRFTFESEQSETPKPRLRSWEGASTPEIPSSPDSLSKSYESNSEDENDDRDAEHEWRIESSEVDDAIEEATTGAIAEFVEDVVGYTVKKSSIGYAMKDLLGEAVAAASLEWGEEEEEEEEEEEGEIDHGENEDNHVGSSQVNGVEKDEETTDNEEDNGNE